MRDVAGVWRNLSAFVDKHPTIKMLALSFLVLIGDEPARRRVRRARAEGLHVFRGMAFAVFVELLNIRSSRKKHEPPVHLRDPYVERVEGVGDANAATG